MTEHENPFAPPSSYRPTAPVPVQAPVQAQPATAPVGPGPTTAEDERRGPYSRPSSTAPEQAGPWSRPADADTAPYPRLPVGEPGAPSSPPGAPALLPGAQPGPQAAPTDSWGRPARERRRRTLGIAWLVPILLLALLAGAGGGWAAQELLEDRPADAALPVSVTSGERGELTGVAQIAAEVLPSVVSIEVSGAQGEGTGSGFVLRGDGFILTNNHVVSAAADGAAEISVVFADGSQEPAEIVGRTSDYDLAVIKVEREGLQPLALADSDSVVVGDPVVAIGAPLGLQGTVTTGIVSALNRPVSAGDASETAFINAIQTDAAINPGNSGGPLVNTAGEVVGINSAIAQPPGATVASGSIGLGFAIPSNQARRTAEELIETGTATYPVIGVLLDARYTGEGVQVSTEDQQGQPAVSPDGPADRAGIEPGDVILEIDGRPVTEADELIVAIRAKAPGDAVVLTVRSGDTEREVRVVLDELASD